MKKKKHLYGWLGLSEQTTANLLQEDSMPFQDRGSVWVDKEANLQQEDSMPLQDRGSVWVDKEAKLQQHFFFNRPLAEYDWRTTAP